MIAFAETKRIRYWRQGDATIDHNFGDLLSELLAKEIVLDARDDACLYRIIGSCIADWVIRDDFGDCSDPTRPIAFWGCGMREEVALDAALQARCLFKGVRGPLTRKALGLPDDTVLGDLGLLVPLIHAPSVSRRTVGKTVCIPHIHDRRSDLALLSLSKADVLIRPNIEATEASLRRMIDDIASASFVLCGALHAAIVAHAYGVPFAFWDGGFLDLPFKWRDFAGSIKISSSFVTSLDEGLAAYELLVAPHQSFLPLSPILSVSPFHVQPTVTDAAAALDTVRASASGLATPWARPAALQPVILRPQSCDTDTVYAAESFMGRLDTMIGEKIEAEARQSQPAAEALLNQAKDMFGSLKDVQADVASHLAKLTTSIEQMLSETRLGVALADAQSQSAALQMSLQKETDARRDEADARQRLQSRIDILETELRAEIEGRRRGAIEQQDLAAQRADLMRDLAQERIRAQQADTERLAVSAKNEAVEAQVAYLRVKLEQAETDAAIGRETSLAEAAAWVRERGLMEDVADRFKAEAKQTREHVAALERRVEIGRLAEVRGHELRGQMQGLTAQRQADARLQAQMLDDHVRRLYIINHRADIIAEIAAARVRMQSKRLALSGTDAVPRHRPLGSRETKLVRERLRTNGLFAPDWYRHQEIAAAGLDDDGALKHFLAKGLVAGRDPHPLVSMAHIARQMASNGERTAKNDAPVLALLDKESRIDPHPLFDTSFYLESNPDVFDYDGTAFEHFMAWGASEGRWPHAAFDPAWYLRQLPGDWARPANPLLHYLTSPEAFYLDPHPLFDATRYLATLAPPHPINPLLHFVTRGEDEARPPHLLFEPAYYLLRNADIAAAGTSPFVHFLRYGDAEHRVCHPLFDPFAYAQANRSNPAAAKPLLHYVLAGAGQNCPTGSQILSPSVLAEAMPDLDVASTNPLVAFLDGKSLSLDVKSPAIASAASSDELSSGGETGGDPVETFALPQRLRDYVDVRFGLPASAALRDLMAVVDRFGDRPNAFALSPSYEDLLDRMQKAAGHAVSEPDVSIIIPIHNALVYTLTCVVSVLESQTRCSFEIIIGDDASTDATSITFGEGLGRIRVITHTEKFGFLANCNATAALARGRHILFLNNDTLALPEWLDALVDLADGDPTIGLVGSKLLNPDGTLQEAGGIVWNDGSAWNFGRGEDANAPAFNYVRDVDYCSGASILVPKQVWTRLDGFDRLFMPAYCEDSDFAFRAREAGYRTVYQPFSEIVHHEGRSHGRDENKGIKQYQTINANKLFTRWRNTLAREHLPNGERVLLARDRSRDRPHLLVVDHYVPQWDRDAGSRTMYSFLRAFVERGVQVLFWPDNLYQDPIYTRPLQELGIEVLYGPAYLGQFERWFSKNAAEIPYVLLSRPHISIKYIDAIKRTSAATILYYGHDLHSRRLLDEYKVNPSEEVARLAQEFGDLELRLWRLSDVVLYPSESERAIVQDMLDGHGTVLAVPAWTFAPDAIDAAGVLGLAGRASHRLLFVGGFTHGPNVDGILWFAETVMPLLQAHDPRFTLTIVGSNAPPQVLALAGPGITILGFVDDATLADLYAEAGVAIAPLRFGGGVKGKVIEAFSKGIPVVTTSVGVQGVGDAEALAFVAETPDTFAAAVIAAAEDRAAAQARVTAALAFVRRDYTADKLMEQLTPTMPELARVRA